MLGHGAPSSCRIKLIRAGRVPTASLRSAISPSGVSPNRPWHGGLRGVYGQRLCVNGRHDGCFGGHGSRRSPGAALGAGSSFVELVDQASVATRALDQIDPRLEHRRSGLNVGSPPYSRHSSKRCRRSQFDPKPPFAELNQTSGTRYFWMCRESKNQCLVPDRFWP